MLPGLEMMAACTDLAVPGQLMQHVAQVESSHNPYAIGVVGGRLVRQPRNLAEAVSTAQMLEQQGRNFSVGLVQVNRYNLAKQGLGSYEQAFDVCSNVRAGSRILAECHARAGQDWGKAFSCYYSGNFTTGYRHGYVQKVFASLARDAQASTDQQRVARRIIDMPAQRSAPLPLPRRAEPLPATRSVAFAPAAAATPDASPAIAQPLSVQVRGQPVAPSALASAATAMPASGQLPQPLPAIPPQSLPERDSAWVF